MSNFDTKKNRVICVLPWVHEYKDLQSQQRPCCWANPLAENRTIGQIREDMVRGTKPRECSSCYDFETSGELSPRITETNQWIKKYGEPDILNPKVESIHILNDPTCNLKCKTCGPESSTLWAKEKNIQLVTIKNNFDDYDLKKIKKINLSGGEPTFNKSYEKLCNDLLKENPDCELNITSNLKSLPDKWKEIITQFKNVSVIISCDAIYNLGSYVRYPLIWKRFEENVKFVAEHANFFKFNLVPSNLVLHKIQETLEWMVQYTNVIHLNQVLGDHWTHKAVPPGVREKYIDALERALQFKISPWEAPDFIKTIKSYLQKYKYDDYDKDIHLRLCKEITEQDSHRLTKLADVDPFLASWIN